LGAKCSSILVETPDIKILVDPGAAGMQPSYPLSSREKERLRQCAMEKIMEAAKAADTIFISHYHYDHHTLPNKLRDPGSLYSGKRIWAKSPNQSINYSQWKRARLFFEGLQTYIYKGKGEEIYTHPEELHLPSPLKTLISATSKDFGEYTKRREELLRKGEVWFKKMLGIWRRGPWVRPFGRVSFVDGESFRIGNTKVRFTQPLFHGIEFDRVGWVLPLIVEYDNRKFIYTSDLQGPQIEDYGEWIVEENPDLLILDGPPTYLFGYMVNRINLNRAKDNIIKIIEKTISSPIIYDHHLLRDGRYRELLKPVYELGKDRVITAAEWIGIDPLIRRLVNGR
jgi:hypothetical protein